MELSEILAVLALAVVFAMAMTYSRLVTGYLWKQLGGLAALAIFTLTVAYVVTRLGW